MQNVSPWVGGRICALLKGISVYFILDLINCKVLVRRGTVFLSCWTFMSQGPGRRNWRAGTQATHEHGGLWQKLRGDGMIHLNMVVPHQRNNPAWALVKCPFHLYSKGKHIYPDYTGSSIFPNMSLRPAWVFRKEHIQRGKSWTTSQYFHSNTQQPWCTPEWVSAKQGTKLSLSTELWESHCSSQQKVTKSLS